MKCTVYYEAWQMECCGTPFSVGDTVQWDVLKNNVISTPVNIGNIDYFYEAHDDRGDKILSFEGKVDEIKILYHKYALSKDNMHLTPIRGKLIQTDEVNGNEGEFENMQPAGYVVLLSECVIKEE